MTPAEIIYQRRVRLLDLARETGNVAEPCRTFGVSRTRFYEWKALAERYGLEALMPKARRTPQLPNVTPTHVVAELLTLAVVEPTIGARQYADRLGDRGRKQAFATALGINMRILVCGAGAAIGVSALLTASPAAYTVVRIVGALYMVWLGVNLLRVALRDHASEPDRTQSAVSMPTKGTWRAWSRGLMTNLLNPNVGAFYVWP